MPFVQLAWNSRSLWKRYRLIYPRRTETTTYSPHACRLYSPSHTSSQIQRIYMRKFVHNLLWHFLLFLANKKQDRHHVCGTVLKLEEFEFQNSRTTFLSWRLLKEILWMRLCENTNDCSVKKKFPFKFHELMGAPYRYLCLLYTSMCTPVFLSLPLYSQSL